MPQEAVIGTERQGGSGTLADGTAEGACYHELITAERDGYYSWRLLTGVLGSTRMASVALPVG